MDVRLEVNAKAKLKGKITLLEELATELKAMGFQPRTIDKLTEDYGHLMVEEGDILKIEKLIKKKGLYYNPIMHYYIE